MSSSSKIILKKSSVENKIPQTSDLEFGELALNFADGKLYFKNSNNEVDAFFALPPDGGNAFTTISVPGSDDIIAESSDDTLNIESSDYIALTTDAATNTVTINTNHDVNDTTETLVARGTNNEFGISRIDFTIDDFDDPGVGQLQWNEEAGTLDLGLNGTDVVLQLGQETLYRVKNQTGSNIPDGTLCMFAGTLGQSGRLLVAPWDGNQPSQFIMGIATEDILNDDDGFVTHFGKVRGIDTTGTPYGETWANGDILYAGPTGGLSNVKPDAPNVKTIVAVVISAHPDVGTLFVRPTFSSNLDDDDLVDLDNLQDGDFLRYINSEGRFENVQIDTDDIDEGTGNLYFTTARARNSLSAGGDLSYNSSTGQFSVTTYKSSDFDTDFGTKDTDDLSEGSGNLYFTTGRIDDHLSGGTGVTYSSGEISIGQSVATTDDVQFNDLVLTGNLTVQGSQTAVETKVPFFLSDGTRSDITSTVDNELPFFLADGSQNNIPLAA